MLKGSAGYSGVYLSNPVRLYHDSSRLHRKREKLIKFLILTSE